MSLVVEFSVLIHQYLVQKLVPDPLLCVQFGVEILVALFCDSFLAQVILFDLFV